MKVKSEIDELNAKFEHLQYRVDNLRDKIYETPNGEHLWEKFEDVLAWSQKYDKNSEEYSKLTKLGWTILDLYLDYLLPKRIK